MTLWSYLSVYDPSYKKTLFTALQVTRQHVRLRRVNDLKRVRISTSHPGSGWADDSTDSQITDASSESKCPGKPTCLDDLLRLDWPDTLKHLVDLHKLNRLNSMSSTGMKQKVTLAKHPENDSQCPDTTATDPQSNDSPNDSTSASTTLDYESNTRKSLCKQDLIPLSPTNIEDYLEE